jgi:hypothetical protein
MKAALIIGHPGHELRAFAFIKRYKPDVYILTDGSGSKNDSRLNQSIKVLDNIGAKFQDSLRVFKDKELYSLISGQNSSDIIDYKNSLKQLIVEKDYDMIIGDALEGFNPTHDICRYIINSIALETSTLDFSKNILNYDFLLDSAPNILSEENNVGGLSIRLSDEEFQMKFNAAMGYPELKFEVEYALEKFGKEAFSYECFRKVSNPDVISNWNTAKPYYEEFGEKRVAEGAYSNLITFEKHLKPIAKQLLALTIKP